MKNKKWLVVLIVIFPSFFWLILETSSINSKRLPFYGPKQAIAKGDTNYYSVTDKFYPVSLNDSLQSLSTTAAVTEPLYAIIFINDRYRQDSYRLTGLWEYLNYKNSKIDPIPFVLVTETEQGRSQGYNDLKKLATYPNIHFYTWHKASFDSLTKSYFKDKPYYIDYSFFLLVDAGRHIRGYYDARYVSEMKRLIEEYQHLKLKDEKQKLIESNDIKKSA